MAGVERICADAVAVAAAQVAGTGSKKDTWQAQDRAALMAAASSDGLVDCDGEALLPFSSAAVKPTTNNLHTLIKASILIDVCGASI